MSTSDVLRRAMFHFGGCCKSEDGKTWQGGGDDGHVHFPDRICFRSLQPTVGIILHEMAHLRLGEFKGHLGEWKRIYEQMLTDASESLRRELLIIDRAIALAEAEEKVRRITDTKPDPSISLVLCKCGKSPCKHNPIAEVEE